MVNILKAFLVVVVREWKKVPHNTIDIKENKQSLTIEV